MKPVGQQSATTGLVPIRVNLSDIACRAARRFESDPDALK